MANFTFVESEIDAMEVSNLGLGSGKMRMNGGVHPVYFLLHLPKTAGQTISRHLQKHCPPGRYFEPNRGAIQLDVQRAPDIDALSGHWLSKEIEVEFANREIRRCVLLRDSVSLHLSLYNYRMMNYRAKGLGIYNFALHLVATPRNYLSYCLLTRWLGISRLQAMLMPEDKQYDLLNEMLQTFWFVGDYRDCDQLLLQIADDLGVPSIAERSNQESQWQEIVAWDLLLESELTADVVQQIRTDNAVDQALWERWGQHRHQPPPSRRSPASRLIGTTRSLSSNLQARWIREFKGALHYGQSKRVRRGDVARSNSDWSAAAAAYREAIGTSNGTPSLWIELARAHRELGEFDKSAQAFDKALTLKPDMRSICIERAKLDDRLKSFPSLPPV